MTLQAVKGGWINKDADRMLRRSVNKKHWNSERQEWEDFVLWTVPYTYQREQWLKDKYGKGTGYVGPNTWGKGVNTISMGEGVYIMMCLQLS